MKSMLGYKLLWTQVTLGIKGKISDIIVTKTKAGVAQWTILSKIKTIVVLFYEIWSSKKKTKLFSKYGPVGYPMKDLDLYFVT